MVSVFCKVRNKNSPNLHFAFFCEKNWYFVRLNGLVLVFLQKQQ